MKKRRSCTDTIPLDASFKGKTGKSPKPPKPAPHYKIIPGTAILVDGFLYKDASKYKSYFLRFFF
jgi:hypothetical protein